MYICTIVSYIHWIFRGNIGELLIIEIWRLPVQWSISRIGSITIEFIGAAQIWISGPGLQVLETAMSGFQFQPREKILFQENLINKWELITKWMGWGTYIIYSKSLYLLSSKFRKQSCPNYSTKGNNFSLWFTAFHPERFTIIKASFNAPTSVHT